MEFNYKGIKLEVPDSVYYPEEDSLLLAEVVSEKVKKGTAFLEIGCGAGLSSIVAAKKGATVTAIDINQDAVTATGKNANFNNVNIKTIVSDLFSSIEGKFDIIAFNPPYLPADESDKYLGNSKAQLVSGPTGRETIYAFLNQAATYLKKDGMIFFIISSLSGEKEVLALCNRYGFKASVIKREKIEWEELILISMTFL
ncbi:MAG: methyltransferase [Candidatus Aenigmarchaeota archaeon]|nr:methyltransferase [Candidatus Aenigmarchaeota archaeon]